MNILLAEDQAMVRTALASLLRLEAGFNPGPQSCQNVGRRIG